MLGKTRILQGHTLREKQECCSIRYGGENWNAAGTNMAGKQTDIQHRHSAQ